MAETAELPADIAGQRADVSALAAFGFQNRVVGARLVDQLQTADIDLSRLDFDRLAVAGEVISTFALDLDGGELRRGLLDSADVTRQNGANLVRSRTFVARLGDFALGIVRIALFAPLDGKPVQFAAVLDERHGFGGLAERDRQAAGGERIERTGVAGALGGEQPLDDADGVGRGHADRLVEDDPAVDVALVAAELLFFGARFRPLPRLRGRVGEGAGV